jgi:hypothetical protein
MAPNELPVSLPQDVRMLGDVVQPLLGGEIECDPRQEQPPAPLGCRAPGHSDRAGQGDRPIASAPFLIRSHPRPTRGFEVDLAWIAYYPHHGKSLRDEHYGIPADGTSKLSLLRRK